MTNRKFIEINSLIRTGYGNEYRHLIVYIDNIASYTEDREGYGKIRLVDGHVYIVKECALEIKRLIEQAEIKQEPKSEWEHDHEILKAYSDGANGVLDELRDEIAKEKEHACADFERYKVEYLGQDWEDALDSLPQDEFRYGMERCIDIINKYKTESEEA